MSDLNEARLCGRLWLIQGDVRYPICINAEGLLQVVFNNVEGERFTLTRLLHPKIGGEAFEFRSAAGRQIAGAGKEALHEAFDEMPMPGPAYRILRQDIHYEGFPNLHKIKLQTLDSRFISCSKRVVTSTSRRVKRTSWFELYPYETMKHYKTVPSDLLRMLEPDQAKPSEFILELIEAEQQP